MKIFALLLLTVSLAVAVPPQPVQIFLSWQDTNITGSSVLDHYVPTTNNCYILYGNQNVNSNPTNWPVIITWTSWGLGTNSQGQVWYTNSISVTPGPWFFSLVASNFWGVALPSNVAQTGPESKPPVLFITR